MQPGQQFYNNPNLSYSAPGQHPVLVQSPPHRNSNRYESYKSGYSLGLGITQLSIGILCMILNVVGIFLSINGTHAVFYAGYGVWNGIFFILAGGFGIGARSKNKCLVITFMVMSIIASVMVWFVIGFAAGGIGEISHPSPYLHLYGYYYVANKEATLAIHYLILVLALIEFVVSIWSSAICCAAACCCNKQQGTVLGPPAVGYNQYNQGFVPPQQYPQGAMQQYPQNTTGGYPGQAYQGQQVLQPPPYNPVDQSQGGQFVQPGYSTGQNQDSDYTPLTDVRDIPQK